MRLSWLLSNTMVLCWSNNLIDQKYCMKETCASYFTAVDSKKWSFYGRLTINKEDDTFEVGRILLLLLRKMPVFRFFDKRTWCSCIFEDFFNFVDKTDQKYWILLLLQIFAFLHFLESKLLPEKWAFAWLWHIGEHLSGDWSPATFQLLW